MLIVATNCCFVNPSEKRKQTNLLISTDVWTVLVLLQKLNICSSNDFSLSLDTFSLLTISFCKQRSRQGFKLVTLLVFILYSKCKEIHFFFQRQQNLLL